MKGASWSRSSRTSQPPRPSRRKCARSPWPEASSGSRRSSPSVRRVPRVPTQLCGARMRGWCGPSAGASRVSSRRRHHVGPGHMGEDPGCGCAPRWTIPSRHPPPFETARSSMPSASSATITPCSTATHLPHPHETYRRSSPTSARASRRRRPDGSGCNRRTAVKSGSAAPRSTPCIRPSRHRPGAR